MYSKTWIIVVINLLFPLSGVHWAHLGLVTTQIYTWCTLHFINLNLSVYYFYTLTECHHCPKIGTNLQSILEWAIFHCLNKEYKLLFRQNSNRTHSEFTLTNSMCTFNCRRDCDRRDWTTMANVVFSDFLTLNCSISEFSQKSLKRQSRSNLDLTKNTSRISKMQSSQRLG